MMSGVRILEEEEALHRAAKKPWHVEESERQGGFRNGAWRRRYMSAVNNSSVSHGGIGRL